MIKKIDHIGIAVKSIEEARKVYEDVLGLKCSAVEEVLSQKVKTVFIEVDGVHIELLEATDPESPIAKFIEKKGEGIHHLSYAVDDLKSHLEQVRAAGCRLINETPVEGAGGKMIAFLHPQSTSGVLTELCQIKMEKDE